MRVSSKTKLLFNLGILQRARQQLIQDFIEKRSDIYKPMFKYEQEGQEVLRELSIEKYFTNWFDTHWLIMKEMVSSQELEPDIEQELKIAFANVYIILLKRNELIHEHARIESVDMMKQLLSKKVAHLENILHLAERDDARWDSMETDIEKHRALFKRTIRRIKEAKK